MFDIMRPFRQLVGNEKLVITPEGYQSKLEPIFTGADGRHHFIVAGAWAAGHDRGDGVVNVTWDDPNDFMEGFMGATL